MSPLSIQIHTHPHVGRLGYNLRAGLYKEFAYSRKLLVDKQLCFRSVNYNFCFTDYDPVASHTGNPNEKGFAFFQFGHGVWPSENEQLDPNLGWCRNKRGLCVVPHSYLTDNGENGYQIIWFDHNAEAEDEQVEIYEIKQGTWYNVNVFWEEDEHLGVYVEVHNLNDGHSRRVNIKRRVKYLTMSPTLLLEVVKRTTTRIVE